ncbi:DUF485 domain-containing protein [Paraburkholderia bengalensis]|uniref:DUF485 domain-containing protein n=1 Tax=Paraburkholderia bengalensis TaxID=2747562 RepID=A0ABU8J063_9BURK
MADADIDWDAVLASERFRHLVRRRRNTIIGLGLLAAIYYFSISALIAWFPAFFTIRLASGINLGTVFAISQYPFGGLIAYVFLRQTARIDQVSTGIKEQAAPAAGMGGKSHAY